MPDNKPRKPLRPAIAFDRASLRYVPGEDILTDVSFEIAHGDFTFLTGPSGAGKSTLLKMIYMALRPSEGRVKLFGEDISKLRRAQLPPLRRRVGVVFQEFRLLEHLSAFENVALPLKVTGSPPKSYREDVAELLTWVGLGHRLDALPETLSGGEKQRVAIARAIVAKPDLLIADEPTGNVDTEMGQRLMRLFIELNRRLGMSVLIATHDTDLLGQVEAEMLTVSGGLVSRGPRTQLASPQANPASTLSEART
jgi:cell division transport system ATP-binding protein